MQVHRCSVRSQTSLVTMMHLGSNRNKCQTNRPGLLGSWKRCWRRCPLREGAQQARVIDGDRVEAYAEANGPWVQPP